MEEFQKKIYNKVQEKIDDTLEKGSESVANFVLPGLNESNNEIIGLHGINGIKN